MFPTTELEAAGWRYNRIVVAHMKNGVVVEGEAGWEHSDIVGAYNLTADEAWRWERTRRTSILTSLRKQLVVPQGKEKQ